MKLHLLLLLSVFSYAPLAEAAVQGPPAPVRVGEVRLETVAEKRLVTGDVRAVRRANVATREPGLVMEITSREGARVEVGDVLAKLDGTRLRLERDVIAAQRGAAQALLEERQRSGEQATRDLATLRALTERDAANNKELSDAETAVAVAQARVSQAEAEITRLHAESSVLEQRIADMVVRAPFAGTVVSLQAEVGQWLSVGGGLVELLSDREVEVWIDVPERYFGAVGGSGEPLRLRVDSTGVEQQVSNFRILPQVDPSSRQFRIVAPLVANGLAPGMAVSAWVSTGEAREVLTVSPDALLLNDVGPYVYMVQESGKDTPPMAMPVAVEELYRSNGRAVLRRGRLQPGAMVVVEGGERLYPTAPILPQSQDGAGRDVPKNTPPKSDTRDADGASRGAGQ